MYKRLIRRQIYIVQ